MYNKYRNVNGEVAQLARASGSYPAGRRFESHLRYQIKTVLQNVVQFFIVYKKISICQLQNYLINKNPALAVRCLEFLRTCS